MATITVRNVDDAAYERLKSRAKANKRSLEAEVRLMIEEKNRDRRDIVAEMRESHRRRVELYGYRPEGESLRILRAVRDEE